MHELPPHVSRVVLIGLMGAGKTTVGRLLADRLQWKFIDLDAAIEQRAGITVSRIFAERGEEAFRSLEEQLTGELASSHHVVLAPGGGWITSAQAVSRVPQDSAVFWLKVSPEEAVRRVQNDDVERPLLNRAGGALAAARELARKRNAKYELHGIAVETENRAPEEIVTEILNKLGDRQVVTRDRMESNG